MSKKGKESKTDVSEGTVKKSISLYMIRHAESGNNQVYRWVARWFFLLDGHYTYTFSQISFDFSARTDPREHFTREALPNLMKKVGSIM